MTTLLGASTSMNHCSVSRESGSRANGRSRWLAVRIETPTLVGRGIRGLADDLGAPDARRRPEEIEHQIGPHEVPHLVDRDLDQLIGGRRDAVLLFVARMQRNLGRAPRVRRRPGRLRRYGERIIGIKIFDRPTRARPLRGRKARAGRHRASWRLPGPSASAAATRRRRDFPGRREPPEDFATTRSPGSCSRARARDAEPACRPPTPACRSPPSCNSRRPAAGARCRGPPLGG